MTDLDPYKQRNTIIHALLFSYLPASITLSLNLTNIIYELTSTFFSPHSSYKHSSPTAFFNITLCKNQNLYHSLSSDNPLFFVVEEVPIMLVFLSKYNAPTTTIAVKTCFLMRIRYYPIPSTLHYSATQHLLLEYVLIVVLVVLLLIYRCCSLLMILGVLLH